MDLSNTENLRLAVIVGAGIAAFGGLILAGKLMPGLMKKSGFRGFDLVLAGVVCFFGGLHLANYWHEKEENITAKFHQQYHDTWWARTARNTLWRGTPLLKCPLDMWVFQEIIHETSPDVIVETGTWQGGSAYFFASMFDLQDRGRVITVDIEAFPTPDHERISYLVGSSTSPAVLEQIKESIHPDEKVMVVLDSDHSKSHVLDELGAYSELVTVGNYLVVEDTHLNGHPVRLGDGDPWGAVEEFLQDHPNFVVDHSREKYGLTWNPSGWLKRVE